MKTNCALKLIQQQGWAKALGENHAGLKMHLVCKGNFYGFGPAIYRYLNPVFTGLIFSNFAEYSAFDRENPDSSGKEILILYPERISEILALAPVNVYPVVNTRKDAEACIHLSAVQRVYLRIDTGLGLHGLTEPEALALLQDHPFKGILLHLNEIIEPDEWDRVKFWSHFAENRNMRFSLGGSAALNFVGKLPYMDSIRVGRAIYLNERATISLHARIIDSMKVISPMRIGYASASTVIDHGTLCVLSLGYSDFPIITQMFQKKVALKNFGRSWRIPTEPAMNTTWVHCEDELDIMDEDMAIFSDVTDIAARLDIDVDHIPSAVSTSVARVYITDV